MNLILKAAQFAERNLREMTGADPEFLTMYKEESMLLRNAMLDGETDIDLFTKLYDLAKPA